MKNRELSWGKRYGKPATGVILLFALAITGCATTGDFEKAAQESRASIESMKKDMEENDGQLRKEITSLSRTVQEQQKTIDGFSDKYETIFKENAELRASILGVTGTIQAFLNAEKKRYEEGLRWVSDSKKTVVEKEAELSGEDPTSKSQPSDGSPSKTQKVVPIAPPVVEKSSTDSDQANSPSIRIFEVLIKPSEVERGSEIDVTVKYDLKAAPESPKLKYREDIELLKGTIRIKAFKNSAEHAPGKITFSQNIPVPLQAVPGIYTIRASVSSGAAKNSKTKTFVVQ